MDIKKALKEIIKDLEKIKKKLDFQYTLIGGIAVGIWGHVRATKDIDIIADIHHDSFKIFISHLKKIGYRCELRQGSMTDDIPYLIKVSIPREKGGEIQADLLIATRKWEDEIIKSSRVIDFGNRKIPVVTPEDLMSMKLRAGGPMDILDVKELLLVLKSEIEIDMLRSRAKQLKVSRKLNKILKEVNIH